MYYSRNSLYSIYSIILYIILLYTVHYTNRTTSASLIYVSLLNEDVQVYNTMNTYLTYLTYRILYFLKLSSERINNNTTTAVSSRHPRPSRQPRKRTREKTDPPGRVSRAPHVLSSSVFSTSAVSFIRRGWGTPCCGGTEDLVDPI